MMKWLAACIALLLLAGCSGELSGSSARSQIYFTTLGDNNLDHTEYLTWTSGTTDTLYVGHFPTAYHVYVNCSAAAGGNMNISEINYSTTAGNGLWSSESVLFSNGCNTADGPTYNYTTITDAGFSAIKFDIGFADAVSNGSMNLFLVAK